MRDLPKEPPSSEITPEPLFHGRRGFIKNAALYAGTATLIGGVLVWLSDRSRGPVDAIPEGPDALTDILAEQAKKKAADAGKTAPATTTAPSVAGEKVAEKAPEPPPEPPKPKISYDTDEEKTPYRDIAAYNNFYEFGFQKSDPARFASSLKPRPWTIAIEGEVARPQTVDIDALLKSFTLEERVYRMRCVEAWSMVIPWLGFPLADLIKKFEPTSKAKYVAFTTLVDPEQFPAQKKGAFRFPYVEGLRMDEAMHPLTMLAVGIYGKVIPNQCGAPIRLVVPWKYGFKGIKSIVSIRFTENEPVTTWKRAAPNEYGFYANVNPAVNHPRWSQATERRIGEFTRRKTLPFNGYAEHVAGLYTGLDLRANY